MSWIPFGSRIKTIWFFEAEGAKLFAPLQAMPFIDGTEVDYVQEGLNQLFKFHNPQSPE